MHRCLHLPSQVPDDRLSPSLTLIFPRTATHSFTPGTVGLHSSEGGRRAVRAPHPHQAQQSSTTTSFTTSNTSTNAASNTTSNTATNSTSNPSTVTTTFATVMLEVTCNDRLGKKVRVKCNPDDTIGDLKKLIAAQTGTRWDKIVLKKWYTIFKDHITIGDYEIHDGMNLELYYQ
ncbi:uncharacterized protein ubl [Procambarus clarkii]